MRPQRSLRLALPLILLFTTLCSFACRDSVNLDQRLGQIAGPYRFSSFRWSLSQLLRGDEPLPESGAWRPSDPSAAELVLRYFSLIDRMRYVKAQINFLSDDDPSDALPQAEQELKELQQSRLALRDTVELIIARQIRETLDGQEIYHPAYRLVPLGFGFPPVNFELDQLPHLLIISPRDRIERMREFMLVPDLDAQTMEGIEAQVDALGLSSLVVGLGGFGGTYPTLVADDVTLEWTLPTVAEEWLHQYLGFTPLGFSLVLNHYGLSPNAEIATLNETVAGIISDEIGEIALETYYPRHAARVRVAQQRQQPPSETEFDFNREMRRTRLRVGELLAKGEVEQAEQFMEERRQYLLSQGYYIRKLNQAYFAFYGTYADAPTSVDPLGDQMRELRMRSPSLSAFLRAVSSITSRQQVLDQLESPPLVHEAKQPGGIGPARALP
jgi:hypothetical protein